MWKNGSDIKSNCDKRRFCEALRDYVSINLPLIAVNMSKCAIAV